MSRIDLLHRNDKIECINYNPVLYPIEINKGPLSRLTSITFVLSAFQKEIIMQHDTFQALKEKIEKPGTIKIDHDYLVLTCNVHMSIEAIKVLEGKLGALFTRHEINQLRAFIADEQINAVYGVNWKYFESILKNVTYSDTITRMRKECTEIGFKVRQISRSSVHFDPSPPSKIYNYTMYIIFNCCARCDPRLIFCQDGQVLLKPTILLKNMNKITIRRNKLGESICKIIYDETKLVELASLDIFQLRLFHAYLSVLWYHVMNRYKQLDEYHIEYKEEQKEVVDFINDSNEPLKQNCTILDLDADDVRLVKYTGIDEFESDDSIWKLPGISIIVEDFDKV